MIRKAPLDSSVWSPPLLLRTPYLYLMECCCFSFLVVKHSCMHTGSWRVGFFFWGGGGEEIDEYHSKKLCSGCHFLRLLSSLSSSSSSYGSINCTVLIVMLVLLSFHSVHDCRAWYACMYVSSRSLLLDVR